MSIRMLGACMPACNAYLRHDIGDEGCAWNDSWLLKSGQPLTHSEQFGFLVATCTKMPTVANNHQSAFRKWKSLLSFDKTSSRKVQDQSMIPAMHKELLFEAIAERYKYFHPLLRNHYSCSNELLVFGDKQDLCITVRSILYLQWKTMLLAQHFHGGNTEKGLCLD